MSDANAANEERVFDKVSRRLVPFLFALFFVNYLDRTNIGFAALTMNRELGLSASFFGLVLAAFSISYLACEIPSNLALQRFGARVWITRIMITWGVAATACAFAGGALSLLGLRVLVGIAEAGFVPGMILYLTYWFPQYRRGKAQAKFLIAQPLAVALGSVISGLLLGLDGTFGLSGWRWLFLLEGLPAIILGLVTLRYLDDRPADARWLTPDERETVAAAVRREAEDREAASELHGPLWRMLFSRNILLISLAYMTLLANYGAASYWLPQITRASLGSAMPYWLVGVVAAIPAIGSAIAMPFLSRRSDRLRERYWHTIVPLMVAGLAWIVAGGTHHTLAQMTALTIAAIASGGIWSLFFTMPSAVLPRRAHALGIAFMNTIGIGGTALAPLVIGYLRDVSGSFSAPMYFIGGLLLCGTLLMLGVQPHVLRGDGRRRATAPMAAPSWER